MTKQATFKTQSGITLKLMPIPPLYYGIWIKNYSQLNPEPQPPKELITLPKTRFSDEEKYLEPNFTDKDYIKAKDGWDNEMGTALLMWTLGHYVSNPLPKDFDIGMAMDLLPYNFDDLSDNIKTKKLRGLWLIGEMAPDELADYQQAHLSLTIVTEEGLDEAKKT